MNKFGMSVLAIALVGITGCTRVETGEVGLRQNFSKQIEPTELVAGSINQTLVGNVLLFQVRDIGLDLQNLNPQTSDNSTLADFDMMVVYSVNPSSVSDLYTTKARAFHAEDKNGDTFLMYNYMSTIARNAAYKSVGKIAAMDTVRSRDAIETDIMNEIRANLKEEKLDTALIVTQVQIRNIQPAKEIVASANMAISKQNELIAKQKEVQIAQAEAQRQDFLSRPQNLEYMRVQAQLNISEGVRDGRVQTIIVPNNFTSIGRITEK